MRRLSGTAILCAAIAACALTGALAASASASPAWKFEGLTLLGNETIVGKALEDRLTIPGLTTKCELTYKMTISNNAGTGKGEITEMQLKNCTTTSKACAVETAFAKETPWPLHLATVGGKNYVILEKVLFEFVYSGEECALAETLVTVSGSAGGLFSNTSSTITFSSLSFAETGTELTALGERVEWSCILTTEATGLHKGQALQVG